MATPVKSSGVDFDDHLATLRAGRTIPPQRPQETVRRPSGSPLKRAATTPKSTSAADRFICLNQFVDVSAKTVNTTAQAAWLVLFRETRNGTATMSFNQIADRIGLGRRAAMRAIRDLENARLVSVVKRGNLTNGPSTYRIFAIPYPHVP